MRNNIFGWLLLALIICRAGSAFAFCSEPSFYQTEPSAPGSYAKPDVPYCMQAYGEGCDRWEIDSYINEVNDYIRKLKNYAEEAQSFANEAINFSNEAVDYANCEAKDVNTQHE